MDNNKIVTKYGTVSIKKAAQGAPYRLYKKIFKSKAHREMIDDLRKIVKKYWPNYKNEDIEKLYSKLSNSGCTYATIANTIIEQLGNDDRAFKEYFGYSLCNSNGTINHNKLMVDIYACLSPMVELSTHKYEKYKFNNIFEAAEKLLNKQYDTENIAYGDLFDAGWIADGLDEYNKLIFKNRHCVNENFLGTYRELAKKLFNIDDVDMDRNKLEKLLKNNDIEYQFDYLEEYSKLSGLGPVGTSNIEKWINKYFEVNNINLKLEAIIIESMRIDYNELLDNIYSKLDEGYSINVGTNVSSKIWMTEGKIWTKLGGNNVGHAMNFEGFDKEKNILVCSWGNSFMIPKDFYQELKFTGIKILSNAKDVKKGL